MRAAGEVLENFPDRHGYQSRMASDGNPWPRDTDGTWHELTQSRFTAADLAQRQYRLAHAGVAKGSAFFMCNAGFRAGTVKLGSTFVRASALMDPLSSNAGEGGGPRGGRLIARFLIAMQILHSRSVIL